MGGKPDRQSDFAVVGAGLAGLATALGLSATGADVTVFEARERVGGRVVSAPQPPTETAPLVLDLGGQWVGPGQTRILGLIEELGLHLDAAGTSGQALWGLGGDLKQGGAALPPLPPLALAEVLTSAALLTLMSKSIQPEAPWKAPRARQWDRVSVHDWINRHLRTRAGREFAQIVVRGNAALEPRETSLLGILFDLRSLGPARNLGTAEAFRVREGTHEIARRLAERFGGKMRFAEPVRAIAQDADGVTVETDASALRCRRVAVCVPPPLARQISYAPALPGSRSRLLAGLEMGASVKFHAVYRRPFWRDRGLSGQVMASSGTIGLTYDNSPDDGTGRGVLVGFAVADAARGLGKLGPAGQEKEILSSLGRLFGPDGGAPEAIVIKDWGAEEWTGGCYAAHFPVGGWTSYGSAFREPCGRIHWAGTETASEWHGYMDGAIRSGDRAAGEMLRADATSQGSNQ
ncbi:MAG: monoamine oxidase [Trebonia sp.]|nr:monoamine oxidase [Trebonia sp.]